MRKNSHKSIDKKQKMYVNSVKKFSDLEIIQSKSISEMILINYFLMRTFISFFKQISLLYP